MSSERNAADKFQKNAILGKKRFLAFNWYKEGRPGVPHNQTLTYRIFPQSYSANVVGPYRAADLWLRY
jgi:hypothetical protein